jgi:hypothetical protein
MPKLQSAPAERVASHFIDYLFDDYQGSRHVRRVAAWVGLLVLGIDNLARAKWKVPRQRQLEFSYRGARYKAKYNHKAGPRGGVDIVQVLPGRGSPEGATVRSMRSLRDAERFYRDCGTGRPWT